MSSADGNAYAQNEIPGFVAATYTPQRGTTDISGARIMGWKSLYTDDETIPTSVDVIVGNALLVQGGITRLKECTISTPAPVSPRSVNGNMSSAARAITRARFVERSM